jgi:signal transduction histidine kinase
MCRDGDTARLTIDDEGPGVPRAERASVFQRYVRLVNVEQGGPPGGGIGLTIVRELADAQNMSVRIDDAPGGGARVVIDIPLVPLPGADRAAAQPLLHHAEVRAP